MRGNTAGRADEEMQDMDAKDELLFDQKFEEEF
jgi:hypothetical protein